MEKLIGGSLFNKPRNAKSRQLRSVLTSKFKFDGAPFRDKTDAEIDISNKAHISLKIHVAQVLKMAYMQFLPALS